MLTKLSLLSLAVFVLTLPLSDCKTTNTAASKPQEPTIRWSIIHQGEDGAPKEAKAGDASISAQSWETTMITCIAEDSGGVKSITLQREAQYLCEPNAKPPENKALFPFPPDELDGKPVSDGPVDTQLFLIREITPKTYPCDGRESRSTLTCQAENYTGKINKATLTINREGVDKIK